MQSKTCFILLAICLSASLLLAACGPLQPPDLSTSEPVTSVPASPSASATVIIGTTEKFTSFDPADILSSRDLESILNISEGLLRNKPGSTELVPGLATGLPAVSSDGLTYTFTLRDGIKFGDGSDFNAKIYAMQLTRLLHTGSHCPDLSTNFIRLSWWGAL
jgi:peptide/nickel transport system substrate-binding protein